MGLFIALESQEDGQAKVDRPRLGFGRILLQQTESTKLKPLVFQT